MMSAVEDKLIEKGVKYAIFDIDNTITKSNVLDLYIHVKRKKFKNKLLFYIWLMSFYLFQAPIFLVLDYISRDLFQRFFYAKYRNCKFSEVENSAEELFELKLKKRFIEKTHNLIFFFKSKGINVLFLSTSIEPIVRQYSNYFKVPYICLKLKAKDEYVEVDMSNIKDFKLNAVRKYNPDELVAIGDSKHDLPFLKYAKYSIVVSNSKKGWIKNLDPLLIYPPKILR